MSERIRQLLLFLTGFVLPQEYLNVGAAGFTGVLTPPKIAAFALLAFAGFDFATRGRRLPADRKHIWILVFAASVPVSALAGFLGGAPIVRVVGASITWYSLFLFYFSAVYVMRSRRNMDTLMLGFVIGTGLAVASAVLGFGAVHETRFGMRTGGAGGNPNMLAFNTLVSIGIAGAFFFSSRALVTRVFSVGTVMVCLAGILVSLSRSGFLGLVTMGGLFLVRTRRFQYAIPAMAVGVLLVVLAPGGWFERIATISADPKDPSARNRIEAIPIIFDAFISSPVVGVGLGRFQAFTYEHDYDVHAVIHNAYLQVLAEQGLVAFVPFMAIHGLAWVGLTRAWRRARRLRAYRDRELGALWMRALMLQIAYSGLLMMGLFAPSHANKGLWLLFALSTTTWYLVRQRSQAVLETAGEAIPEVPRDRFPAGLPSRAPAGPARV